jgi:hypothetical protein
MALPARLDRRQVHCLGEHPVVLCAAGGVNALVGLTLGAIGLALNFKSGGWPKVVSIVALILLVPVSLFTLYAMISGAGGP